MLVHRNCIVVSILLIPLSVKGFNSVSPDSALFYMQRGICCERDGNPEEAVEELKKALAFDPQCAEAHVKLAEIYTKRGTLEGRIKAERHLRRAIKLDPSRAYYRVIYGLLKLKQGFRYEAKTQFEKAVELDPHCGEAYYYLGKICMKEVWHFKDMIDGPLRFEHFAEEDERKAIEYFRKVLDIDSNHRNALFDLGLIHCESGSYDEMAELFRRIRKSNPEDKDARLFLGLAFYRQGLEAEAWDEFEEAKSFMREDERMVFESIETLLSPEEEKQYLTASLLEKNNFEDRFWLEQDPLYLTEYNERILEHYSRVAYANLRYGFPEEGREGWKTDQGKVYIRYGPPLNRARTRPSIEPAAKDPVRTSIEVWQYRGFDHVFEDMYLNGHYRFKWGARPETDGLAKYNSLIKEVPQVYDYDFGGEQFIIPCFLANFRGKEGKTTVDVCYALPAQYLDYTVEKDVSRVFTEVGTFFFDNQWKNVVRDVTDQELVTERIDPTKKYDVIAQRTVQIDPGMYHFALEVKDKESENVGILRDTVDIRPYNFKDLQMSDILFASNIEPAGEEGTFCKGDFHIDPNPRKRYFQVQPVYIYYEIYNLQLDVFGQTHYEIEYTIGPEVEERKGLSKLIGRIGGLIGAKQRKGLISATSENKGRSSTEHKFLKIDISGIPPEATMLLLTVRDLNSNQKAVTEDRFVIWYEK